MYWRFTFTPRGCVVGGSWQKAFDIIGGGIRSRVNGRMANLTHGSSCHNYSSVYPLLRVELGSTWQLCMRRFQGLHTCFCRSHQRGAAPHEECFLSELPSIYSFQLLAAHQSQTLTPCAATLPVTPTCTPCFGWTARPLPVPSVGLWSSPIIEAKANAHGQSRKWSLASTPTRSSLTTRPALTSPGPKWWVCSNYSMYFYGWLLEFEMPMRPMGAMTTSYPVQKVLNFMTIVALNLILSPLTLLPGCHLKLTVPFSKLF